MEPHIQYAQTKDGVNIASYAIGERGTASATASPPLSHYRLARARILDRTSYQRL